MNCHYSEGTLFFRADLKGNDETVIVDIPPHEDEVMFLPNEGFLNLVKSTKRQSLRTKLLPTTGFR